jgi:hypothetical protein
MDAGKGPDNMLLLKSNVLRSGKLAQLSGIVPLKVLFAKCLGANGVKKCGIKEKSCNLFTIDHLTGSPIRAYFLKRLAKLHSSDLS